MPTSDELPDHLRRPPRRPRDWPLPTAWLLGTKLLGSLRDMLLSSVVKVDLRTWMTAGEVIDLTADTQQEDGEPCCYLDFLADTGDSQRLVYQLARLLKQERLTVKSWQGTDEVSETLPRGSLLVLGGDIGYPVATHRRLLERIRAPFEWAHDEFARDPAQAARLEAKPVTLLAVPGNHDYYDGLRGFEALVHSPPVAPVARAHEDAKPPSERPLRLPGYRLAQHASYVAAALPFGWRLWALDIEMHAIDDRQAAYFEWAKRWRPGTGQQPDDPPAAAPGAPDRLILVTSRPAFVYQGRSDHADVIEHALTRLDLTPAFARGGQLERERVRLDLSGDVHLYERYWGTDHTAMPDDVDKLKDADARGKPIAAPATTYEAPDRYRPAGTESQIRKRGNDALPPRAAADCTNYASVVSGLGGTFHHPSQVRMGTTPPRAAWPSAERSAREIGVRLVDPYQMFRAGAVGIVGLAIALLFYALIWKSRTDPAAQPVNVLDVPFAFPLLSDAQCDALRQLGIVAAIVGLVVAMIALPVAAYYAGRWLVRPIREMQRPTGAWPRLTYAITHWRPIRDLLRFLGGNPRSMWSFLTTIWPLAGTIAGWYGLVAALDRLGARVTSGTLAAVYVVITLLVVGMSLLGALRAGEKSPLERWPANLARRVFLCGFGAFIALLVVWTPYAWVRMICISPWVGAFGAIIVVLTMLVRLGGMVFRRGLTARRIATWTGFLLLVAGAVLLPRLVIDGQGTTAPLWSQWHELAMLPLVAFFGAYFACLWVGWYFCICLQWNRHGNEAGGAARVTEFGEFLRIKLTRDRAEVWAIAVEEAPEPDPRWHHKLFRRRVTCADAMPTARLIDHFVIAAPDRGTATVSDPARPAR